MATKKRHNENSNESEVVLSETEALEKLSKPELEAVIDIVSIPKPEVLVSSVNLPEPVKAIISLRVFTASGGVRWEQIAGFRAYAKTQNLESLTMEEWRREFEKFQNRPTT